MDQGNPIGPNYYVAEDNYPFAIDLPITDYQIPDESVKIDKFYPGFSKWAKVRVKKILIGMNSQPPNK